MTPKIKHKFVYRPPGLHNDMCHEISYKLRWGSKLYGEFITTQDCMWEPMRKMRNLVLNKHELIANLVFADQAREMSNETL